MNSSIQKNISLIKAGLLILIISLFTIGCNKEIGDEKDIFDSKVSKTILNEPYGTGNRQVADIYLPANRNSDTKVLVILHGGSWSEGDKTDLNEIITLLKAQWPEAAIINMNYRLANNTAANFHPGQMNDIDAMLDFVATKRNLWQIGDKTALAGVSAGAHLSMLYSYAYNASNRIKAVVSIVGPTDFSDPFYSTNPIFQLVAANFLGKTWTQDAELHKSVSPALRVNASSPPTFMAYGTLDPIVPISNAVTLRSKLETAGIAHIYHEYPTEGHEFGTGTINILVPEVIKFLKTKF
jgi:acetyl esterase/lipase